MSCFFPLTRKSYPILFYRFVSSVNFLSALFYLLGDEGDACLIPAPYYAAFENDMRMVARIVPFAVQMANPIQGPSANELDLAYIEAKSVSKIEFSTSRSGLSSMSARIHAMVCLILIRRNHKKPLLISNSATARA